MNRAAVGDKPPTIKPGDLVRTPSGETGVVEGLNPDGSRLVRLRSDEVLAIKPQHLFLVRAAPIMPWPSRLP